MYPRIRITPLLVATLMLLALALAGCAGHGHVLTDPNPAATAALTHTHTQHYDPSKVMDATRGGGPGPGASHDADYRVVLDNLCREGWSFSAIDPDFINRNKDWYCSN